MMFYNTIFCRREILAFMCPADGFGTSMEILRKATKNTNYSFFVDLLLKKGIVRLLFVGLVFGWGGGAKTTIQFACEQTDLGIISLLEINTCCVCR